MEHYFRKAEEDPTYAIVLPITIVCHRFERDHQGPSKPRILVRSYDEDGLTMGYSLGKTYERSKSLWSKLESLINEVLQSPQEKVLEALNWLEDPEIGGNIKAMALADGAEGRLLDGLRYVRGNSREIDELPPIFLRQYDEMGIPISYSYNPNCITVYERIGNDKKVNMMVTIQDKQKPNSKKSKLIIR